MQKKSTKIVSRTLLRKLQISLIFPASFNPTSKNTKASTAGKLDKNSDRRKNLAREKMRESSENILSFILAMKMLNDRDFVSRVESFSVQSRKA